MALQPVAYVRHRAANLLLKVGAPVIGDGEAAAPSSGYLPCLSSHCCIRRCTLGRDNSANCSSKPGLFVRKRFRFHSQMHAWADGTPERTDAPAPRKRACGIVLVGHIRCGCRCGARGNRRNRYSHQATSLPERMSRGLIFSGPLRKFPHRTANQACRAYVIAAREPVGFVPIWVHHHGDHFHQL